MSLQQDLPRTQSIRSSLLKQASRKSFICPFYQCSSSSHSDKGVLGVEVPFLSGGNLPNSSVTWNYTTTPQTSLNNRVLSYTRGRVLGGSSSISKNICNSSLAVLYNILKLDFMVYTRGSNDEYDRWAEITKDQSWAWKNLEQYYLKVFAPFIA